MKVFVAGATGVLGRSAVAALVAAGHQVTGTARTAGGAALLRAAGAEPTNPDLFDPHSVTFAVAGHDVVCNFATKIPGPSGYFRRSAWAANDRLHAEASRHLVDAVLKALLSHLPPDVADGTEFAYNSAWRREMMFQHTICLT